MKKLYTLAYLFASACGFCQTILNQSETSARTVQDPNLVLLAPGFHAASSVSNPFVARIGNSETPPTLVDSEAGSGNPSGTSDTEGNRFHDTQGNIDVNGGGQLQFTLPIALPPGVKSVAPQVNLVYTSGSGNGIAGYGWNLSGITSISRVGRNIEKDGEVRGIQLDYSDYYTFNGQRLILKHGSPATYGKDGAEYVTEKFSNIKIKSVGAVSGVTWKGPEYWEVTFEDGSQAWYGAGTTGASDARTPAEYNIVKWRDAQGNYIGYSYTQTNNVAVISSIRWGGNETLSTPHFNEINLYYNIDTTRYLKEVSYTKDVQFLQDKILSKIEVKANLQSFRSYQVQYDGTRYQYVKSITEENGETTGNKANPIIFDYENDEVNSTIDNYKYLDFNDIKLTGDFDGNGIVDFIISRKAEPLKCTSPSVPDITYFNLGIMSTAYINCNVAPTGTVPAGHYVRLNNKNFYLGNQDFDKAVSTTIIDVDGYLSPKKGIALYQIDPLTQNASIYYYLIDESKLIKTVADLLSPQIALKLIKTKTISKQQYDESYSQNGPLPGESHSITTSLGKLYEYDLEGDGISELLIEKNNQITSVVCVPSVQKLSKSETIANRPPADCDLTTSQYDTKKLIIVKQDESSPVNEVSSPFESFDKAVFGDFDGNGTIDIATVNGTSTSTSYPYDSTECYYDPLLDNNTCNTVHHTDTVNRYELTAYSINKNSDSSGYLLTQNFSARFDGNKDYIQVGDFNGDGKSDLFVRTNHPSHYILSLNQGLSFDSRPYFNRFNDSETSTTNTSRTYSTAKVIDVNNDGKSDILNFYSKTNFTTQNTGNSTFTVRVDENVGFENGQIQFNSTPAKNINSNKPYIYQEAIGNYADYFYNSSFSIYGHSTTPESFPSELWQYEHYADIQKRRIKTIKQGGIETNVFYNIPGTTLKGVKKEKYPYLEAEAGNNISVVTTLNQILNVGTSTRTRAQSFLYRGLITHLQGRGMVGFRQTARSSWYTDDLVNTKIWSGTEIDALHDGVPIKEWSIKTSSESEIFPADISENNTQLLSFKSTEYRFDKLLNGNPVDINTVSSQDKSKIVSASVPIKSVSKDFMKDVRSENRIVYDQEDLGPVTERYYLPTKTISSVNNGFAVSTTTLKYVHNASGAGKDYYIGRPESKTEQMTLYGDTKGAKEEYTYENNLLKSKKSWNRDNSGWFLETYNYDGFGNITVKTATNSIDSNSKTERAEYDPKGRFVIKKTDNLGLETVIDYNDWGQVTVQTDPMGLVLNNEYDKWGKLLKSKTNLGGTTSYEYRKESNGDAVVTEHAPDSTEKISYTNKLGENYLSKSRKFGQGQYVSAITVYDGLGRKTAESEPFSGSYPTHLNTTAYDDYSRPIKATSFTGKILETAYSGRTVTVTETNANNRFKKQTADALGNIISTEDLGGVIYFKFNAAGENIETNYEGNIVKTSYDAWGNKVRFEDPSNGVYEYQYSGFMGAISKINSPKGEKTYEYNSLGQLTIQKEKSAAGNTTDKAINFSYNSKGMITGKSGTSLGKAYSSGITYDSYGRVLSSYEDSNGKYFMKKGITYDDKMRVTSYEKQLYSSGILTKVSIENEYDAWSGVLYRVKEKGTGKILWQLDEVNDKGQVTQAKLGDVHINNTYAANGFLNNINHTGSAGNTVLQIGYSFNAIKNELNSRTTGGDFNILEQFQYDDNNRLFNWTDPVTGAFTQNQQRNVFDNKGRITQNDQVGTIKFDNTVKKYQATGMVLNTAGTQNYTNDLVQSITYNENNDPFRIDGLRGDVAFEYGLTAMRQRVTYGGNFLPPTPSEGGGELEGKFTKYYSEDASFEVIRNNQTGQEKHLIYIGGSPYEADIVYLKNYTESSGSFKFLHKDYLGSVLAITDEAGTKLEQRHFDAWGNLTHLKIGSNATITDKEQIRNYLSDGNLVVDRGYTSHEHFAEVGLIHMNGRLYDPLLRRFLNADENIQDSTNTQNYNKYGYVLNNPLMYNDPNGEFFMFLGLGVLFWKAVIIGAAVGLASYTVGLAATGNLDKWNIGGALKATFFGALGGAASFGVGSIFSAAGEAGKAALTAVGHALDKSIGGFGLAVVQAGTHAISQGVLGLMQGSDFLSSAVSGFAGSLGASGWSSIMGTSGGAMIAFGALSGGIGAELSGGNFWQGAITGGIVAGLNHAMHKMAGPGDPEKTRKAKAYAKEYKANKETLLAVGMMQEFLFETMDFGEFDVADFREFVISRSNPNDTHLQGANALYSKGVEYFKSIEDILPAKGRITNTIKTKIIVGATATYAPMMIEQEYNSYMIKRLDINVHNQLFPKFKLNSFSNGGTAGGW